MLSGGYDWGGHTIARLSALAQIAGKYVYTCSLHMNEKVNAHIERVLVLS